MAIQSRRRGGIPKMTHQQGEDKGLGPERDGLDQTWWNQRKRVVTKFSFATFVHLGKAARTISAGSSVSVPVQCCQMKSLSPPHTHTLSASVKQLPARIPKEGYTLQVQTLLQHLWKVFMLNKHAISRSNLYEVIPEINATKQTIHDEYLPQGQKIPEFDWNTLHKGNKKKNSQAHISTMPYTMLIFSWIL